MTRDYNFQPSRISPEPTIGELFLRGAVGAAGACSTILLYCAAAVGGLLLVGWRP